MFCASVQTLILQFTLAPLEDAAPFKTTLFNQKKEIKSRKVNHKLELFKLSWNCEIKNCVHEKKKSKIWYIKYKLQNYCKLTNKLQKKSKLQD